LRLDLSLGELQSNIIVKHLFVVTLDYNRTLYLFLLLHLLSCLPVKYLNPSPFHKILQFRIRHIVPVLEPTEQVADPHYAELLVVHLQVPLVILLLSVCRGFSAVVTVAGIVVVKLKPEAQGQLMTLLETPWDQAHMFETFLVQVFNKEPKDALMISPDI